MASLNIKVRINEAEKLVCKWMIYFKICVLCIV